VVGAVYTLHHGTRANAWSWIAMPCCWFNARYDPAARFDDGGCLYWAFAGLGLCDVVFLRLCAGTSMTALSIRAVFGRDGDSGRQDRRAGSPLAFIFEGSELRRATPVSADRDKVDAEVPSNCL